MRCTGLQSVFLSLINNKKYKNILQKYASMPFHIDSLSSHTSLPPEADSTSRGRCLNKHSTPSKRVCNHGKRLKSITGKIHTDQVTDKDQVGDGEQRGHDVQPHAVECADVDHHQVYVDAAHPQDHEPTASLQHAGRKAPLESAHRTPANQRRGDTYHPLEKSPISEGMLVKVRMGMRAKGSWGQEADHTT